MSFWKVLKQMLKKAKQSVEGTWLTVLCNLKLQRNVSMLVCCIVSTEKIQCLVCGASETFLQSQRLIFGLLNLDLQYFL